MTNPKIDLDDVAKQLKLVGFEPVTNVLFRRGFVDIEIKDAIVPDGFFPEPWYRVKVYSEGNEYVATFDKMLDFRIFENDQT